MDYAISGNNPNRNFLLKLLTFANHKTRKGENRKYVTAILHLAPARLYDYTKSFSRMRDFLRGKMPQNYHLTFSHSEKNLYESHIVLSHGGNVAAVGTYDGIRRLYPKSRIIYGEFSDLRFLDLRPSVVLLRPKGRAILQDSSFVLR